MRTITIFSMLILLTLRVQSQDPTFGLGCAWGIQVVKSADDFTGFPNGTLVEALVEFKDTVGNVIYSENHSGTLSNLSYLEFVLGEGTNPMPVGRLKAADYGKVAKLCYKLTVHVQEGPVMIMQMQDVRSAPRANYSHHSANTDAVSGREATFDFPIEVSQFIRGNPTKKKEVVALSQVPGEPGIMQAVNISNMVKVQTATSAVSGATKEYIQIGDGSKTPMHLGGIPPEQLENYTTLQAILEDTYKHLLGLEVLPNLDHNGNRSPINHNTAALFANNTENPMSAGVLATAQTWGVYGSAQNGTVGITNGLGNGAGATGFVANAPDTGGFKYGLYANANSIINAWAAALFGNSFYTGTLTMSSDARLKTEIRSQSDALDKVMQLKPSLYTYRQDTPYSLPQGLHHGFLAQDVEEVFPELVSDITMPLTLDPQEMYKGGSTEYKGINYIEMIAILTSALQEMNTTLNAKIDAQAKEIEALKAQLK